MPSHGSSSRRSSTPHVNAPCEPPPCNARSTRIGSRVKAVLVGSIGIGPRKNYVGAGNRPTGNYQHAVALSLASDGTAIATEPNEMRNALGKAAAEAAEQRNDDDDNENEDERDGIASCRLASTGTPLRVRDCTILLRRAAALHASWRHEKISSVNLRPVVNRLDPSKSRASAPG